MKQFTIFLFILVASSTYRCEEPENTIDCKTATASLVGNWEGTLLYDAGYRQNIDLRITSNTGCTFLGTIGFEDSHTVFIISGTVDKYGWVKFSENDYFYDGGEYTGCNGSGWSNPCDRWPFGRYKTGTKYEEARLKNNNTLLNGSFYQQASSWNSTLRGDFTLEKLG